MITFLLAVATFLGGLVLGISGTYAYLSATVDMRPQKYMSIKLAGRWYVVMAAELFNKLEPRE